MMLGGCMNRVDSIMCFVVVIVGIVCSSVLAFHDVGNWALPGVLALLYTVIITVHRS